MGIIKTAAEVWRKYVIPNVPVSGDNQPDKGQIVSWGTWLESMLGSGAAGLAYQSLALLSADLAHDANTAAIVWNDGTAANNGLYSKVGASGTGSWTRLGDLPNGVVRLTVTGGTANAIVATAPESPTLPGSKLYLLTPAANNTGATTIVVNGGAAVAIKNTLNSSLAANSLIDDSTVLMAWVVDHYQLMVSVPVDATGVLNDTLAARDAAAASAAAAATSAAALGNQVRQYDTRAQAAAATVPAGVNALRLLGYSAVGDGEPSFYKKLGSTPSPVKAWHLQTADGAYWILVPLPSLRPEWLGAFPDGTDAGPGIRACRDYIVALGGGTIDFGPAGRTFTISTLRTQRMFEPASNMAVEGSATIKLGNGVVTGSNSFFGIGVQNFTSDICDNFRAEDITLDFNGANNQTTGYCAGILIGIGKDIALDGITVKNHPSSQPICLGVNAGLTGQPSTPQIVRPIVSNCRVLNCGKVVNSSVTDCSAIYVVGTDFVIEGNVIANDTQDTVGTGIEAKGAGTIRNNVIRKVSKGYNIGAHPDTDVTIGGNKITDCYAYAMFWNHLSGEATYGLSAVISGDHVVTSLVNSSYFIDMSSQLTGTAAEEIKFSGCYFESTVAPGNAAFIPVAAVGPAKHFEFNSCTFKGFPGAAIALGGNDIINNKTSLHISGNYFINCCTTVTAGHANVIDIAGSNALASFISVGNTFQSDGGTYAAKCFNGGTLTTAVGASLGAVANNIKNGIANYGL